MHAPVSAWSTPASWYLPESRFSEATCAAVAAAFLDLTSLMLTRAFASWSSLPAAAAARSSAAAATTAAVISAAVLREQVKALVRARTGGLLF